MSFRRGFVQLLFAMLLLFAQQQALAHLIQHWHDGYPAQSDGGGKQKSHSELCDFHATFAELLGASVCALAMVLDAGSTKPADQFSAQARPTRLVIPSSRGPPSYR